MLTTSAELQRWWTNLLIQSLGKDLEVLRGNSKSQHEHRIWVVFGAECMGKSCVRTVASLCHFALLCFFFLYLVIRRTILILSQNENKRGLTTPPHEKKGASWCLPSKHSVCMPFSLFFFTLSKKLSGLQVSVQKTIETVSPNLYN